MCFAYYSPSFIRTNYILWRMQIVKLVLVHSSNSDEAFSDLPSHQIISQLSDMFCLGSVLSVSYHKERRCCLATDRQKCSSFRSRPNWPIIMIPFDFFWGGRGWYLTKFFQMNILCSFECVNDDWNSKRNSRGLFSNIPRCVVRGKTTQKPRMFVETIPTLCPINLSKRNLRHSELIISWRQRLTSNLRQFWFLDSHASGSCVSSLLCRQHWQEREFWRGKRQEALRNGKPEKLHQLEEGLAILLMRCFEFALQGECYLELSL
jgi:hypothetical protein